MNQQKQNGNLIAIITMFFLFAMISFVTNLAAMNFLAYLFMGIPAGNMLVKIGYKKTALIAMAVGFLGLFTQYLSSLIGADVAVFSMGEYSIKLNFIIYLLGAFICGFCVCMLNTVVNPMLNLLGGGGNKGNQLIQAGGALNSLSGTLTPLFVGVLIGTVTPETAMSDVTPLLFIAMGVFLLSFIVILFVAIPEPHLHKGNVKEEKFSHSPWSFRHTVLGVFGIFVYVGIEIGIPGTLNFYLADASDKGAGILFNGAAIGGAIAAIYWLLMLVGRLTSTIISGKVSTRTQLITVSATAILFIVFAIFIPKNVGINVPKIVYDPIAKTSEILTEAKVRCKPATTRSGIGSSQLEIVGHRRFIEDSESTGERFVPRTLRLVHIHYVGRNLQPCRRRIRKIYCPGIRYLHDDGCGRRYLPVAATSHFRLNWLYGKLLAHRCDVGIPAVLWTDRM